MARWEFILCKTPPPRNPTGPLQRICPITFDGEAQIEMVRNRAGSFSCSTSIDSEVAKNLLDRMSTGDVRGSMRKCVVVKRNNKWMWSGPISAVNGEISGEGGKISISAVGWLEYLYQREFHGLPGSPTKTWNNTGQDMIVHEMLDLMLAQDAVYPTPIFKGGRFGKMIVISKFSINKGQKFGEAIQTLSDVEGGFDMEVDPVTRELNLYAWDTYNVNKSANLGYHWGPNNIESLQWQENGMQARTRITAIGEGNKPYHGFDDVAADDYGILEETIQLGEADDAILDDYVAGELIFRSRPIVNYTIVPKINSEAPQLFNDFEIGDQIYFTAREGAFFVKNHAVRVFGATISVDSEMNEKVSSLVTSPAHG